MHVKSAKVARHVCTPTAACAVLPRNAWRRTLRWRTRLPEQLHAPAQAYARAHALTHARMHTRCGMPFFPSAHAKVFMHDFRVVVSLFVMLISFSESWLLERIFGNPIWFDGRLSCKLILTACIFFRHQRKIWLSSAARLLRVTPLDHACLLKLRRLSFRIFCFLRVSGSCLCPRAASRHRYAQKKKLIVFILTLIWREGIEQNRDS